MDISEPDKLDRIGAALYQKIMKMEDVAEFKNWVNTVTPQQFKKFIKDALQEMIDNETQYLKEIAKVEKDISS